MVGGNARLREMWIGGGCMGNPPPWFKKAPNQKNSETRSMCSEGFVSQPRSISTINRGTQ